MRGGGGILAVTLWPLPSPDMTVSTTGTPAGAGTVGGLRLPPALTVKTAGSRTLLVAPGVWIGPPGWWVGVCAGVGALAQPVEAPEVPEPGPAGALLPQPASSRSATDAHRTITWRLIKRPVNADKCCR